MAVPFFTFYFNALPGNYYFQSIWVTILTGADDIL